MNREQARQWLPILEAFANGDTIQYRFGKNGEWSDCLDHGTNTQLLFTNPISDYRIKPKTREFWIPANESYKYCAPAYINEQYGLARSANLIKVREVLD